MSDLANAIDGLVDYIDMYLQLQDCASAWNRAGKPVKEYELHLVALRNSIRVCAELPIFTEGGASTLVNEAVGCVSQNEREAAAAINRWSHIRENLKALEESRRADPASPGSTLGWLISQLERCEESNRPFRFNADTPGIERIKHLCYARFAGSGLTAANIRQLKVLVCNKLKWNSEQAKCADGLPLDDVANVIEGIQRIPFDVTQWNAAAALIAKANAAPSAIGVELERCAPTTKKGKRGRGGRRSLEKSTDKTDILKLQIYQRIKMERDGGLKPKGILEKLTTDKDFKEQVADAKEKLGNPLIRAALAYYLQPKKRQP